jgi:hypothetical protein
MSRYLYFNTKDRSGGVDGGDCYFETGQRYANKAYYLTLSNASIPIVFYPLSTYRKNYQLYLQEDGNTSVTTVVSLTTDKNYNGVTLAVEIDTQLNLASGKTYGVSYDSEQSRFTVTVSSGTFRFVSGANSAHIEVGYDVLDPTFHSTGFEFPYPIDVSGTKYIDIHTNLGSQNTWNSTGTFNVTSRIMCVASFGEVLQFENPVQEKRFSYDENDRIEFQLRDDRGHVIRFGNNHHCSFTFVIWPKE